MRVIIGCEESAKIRTEFEKLGHDAWSCDLLPSRIPGKHFQCDVREILHLDWDLMIAHPPCTFLTVTGNRWNKPEYISRFPTRKTDIQKAVEFFHTLWNAPIKRICLELPVSIMSTLFRQPDQLIQPYFFGDPAQKRTCLWLKNLPTLVPTQIVEPEFHYYKTGGREPQWHYATRNLSKELRAKARSETFSGIAKAMAEQWGKSDCICLKDECDCESPETNPALISNECPIHNWNPYPNPECPIHSANQ